MEDFFSLRDRLNIFVSGLTIEKHVSLGKIGEFFFNVNVSKLLPVMWITSNSFPKSLPDLTNLFQLKELII